MRRPFTDGMDTNRIRLRDAATRRLRNVTVAVIGGAGALGLLASGLAAKAFPGRSSTSSVRTVATTTTTAASRAPAQTPPPLVAVAGSAPALAQSQAPVSSAPVQSSAPPVAVSGGS